MWHYASEMEPDLKFLSEVDERGQYKLSDEKYERCLWKIQQYVQMNKRTEGGKYECGVGVRVRDDRLGGNRYGTERERYNGKGGGRVFKWYSRAVFNSFKTC